MQENIFMYVVKKNKVGFFSTTKIVFCSTKLKVNNK